MKGLTGTVLSIVIAFVLLGIVPIYYTSVIQYAKSSVVVMTEARRLIDDVIDTGELTEEMLTDFNIGVASAGSYYNVTIMRKVPVTNPDPTSSSSSYVAYVAVDDIYNYNQGDRIVVAVEPIGQSVYQLLSRVFLGISVTDDSFTLAGRVR